MRYLSLIGLLSIIFCQTGTSQNVNAKTALHNNGFEITVQSPMLHRSFAKSGSNTVIDYTDYTDPSKAGTLKLPYQDLIIAVPPNSKPSITLSPIKSEIIANASVRLNPKQVWNGKDAYELEEQTRPTAQVTSLPLQFEVVNYFWYRDLYCAHVRVRLAAYNYSGNSVDELSSYKISVSIPGGISTALKPYVPHNEFEQQFSAGIANADIAETLRSAQPKPQNDPTLDWISLGSTYVKIGVCEDRIYRISRHDLENLGIGTSAIQPYTLKIFESGTEIPIFVSSPDSTVFASSDYIEFYGKKNYSKISPRLVNPDTEPYYTYLNVFSDTSVYFLTWGGNSGKRAPIQNSSLTGISETLEYYTDFIHAEKDAIFQDVSATDPYKNQDPTRLDAKAWFNDYVYGGNNSTGIVNVQASDVIPGKNASIYSRLISSGSDVQYNSHSLSLALKVFPNKTSDTLTTSVDQRTINRNDIVVLRGNIPSDSIKTGLNTICVRNWKNGTSVNNLLLDWVELEYPRALKAKNDSLYFEYLDSNMVTAPRILKVSNLSTTLQDTAYTVYRIKPSIAKITGAVKSGNSLSFSDNVGFGSAYYIIANTMINEAKPLYQKKKTFTNLRNPSRKADYIAIAHPSMLGAATTYTGFIKDHYKTDTTLVMVDDIYDEFAYGYPVPSSIRAFLKAAFQNWQSPKPSALMILGQACYDYKNYYDQQKHDQTNFNLVPSYGEPVSDTWYTMFGDTSLPLQQMLVGRLPAKKEADILDYLTKHQKYVSQRLDLWNKRALLFSGGDAADTNQLKQLKAVNDQIVSSAAAPKPLSMNSDHFYKIKKGETTYSFGPFDASYVQRALDIGGLFISYIGHSATRTWDNSIDDPNQLLNKNAKSPLVTDFGCSTNRFAEPNVSAFGELFINTGQTISYLGNSSFGFLNTTTTVPQMFYSILLKDSVRQIAQAHFNAKLRMFTNLGTSNAYRIFALTNLMLGDPLVRLAVPTKPNLTILDSNIVVVNAASPNDGKNSLDSVRVVYKNYGIATTDSVDLKFEDHYEIAGSDSVIFSREFRVPPVGFCDTLLVVVPTENRAGKHLFTVKLDQLKKIDELYEDDNEASLLTNVASLSVKVITPGNFSAQPTSVTLLGSTAMPDSHTKDVIVQFDTSESFPSPHLVSANLDTFFTKIPLSSLPMNKRFWGRVRFNQADTAWSNIFQIYKSAKSFPFLLEDDYSFNQMNKSAVTFENGLKIASDSVHIEVRSSGQGVNSGAVNRNGVNLLDNSSGWGVGVAVIDPVTLKADTGKFFYYGATPANADSLAKLLNRVPAGKLVCLVVITDGTDSRTPALISAVKACGSKLFEGLVIQEPWAFMGIKGGKVIFEKKESNTYTGFVTYDTAFFHRPDNGFLTTAAISQASKYTSAYLDASVPGTSAIVVKPIGYKTNGTADTLTALSFNASGLADISEISPTTYPSLKFLVNLQKAADTTSPTLRSFGVNYDGLAELGINYQSVASLSNTFMVGDTARFAITLNNAAAVKADNIKITAEVVYKDNSKTPIDTRTISTIPPESRLTYQIPYGIGVGDKDRTLRVTIDPDNSIKEYYKDNNVYNLPFTVTNGATDTAYVQFSVKKDSGASILSHVFEGDFVDGRSLFQVEMYDSSLNAVSDTTFIKIFLDDKQYFYDSLQYKFNDFANPKMTVSFQPKNYTLSPGEHTVQITGVSGSRKVAIDTTIKFTVSNDLKLLSVYNYPNPFNPAKGNTYFTFQVTSLPDELQLKIYTVSGRLIRKINQTAAELTTGFNKSLSWDGRDEDGDMVANGVYLYKILVKQHGKSVETISKLVIIR